MGKSGCIRAKLVVFWQKVVVLFEQSGCIRVKVVVAFGQSVCIPLKLFYSGKIVVVFGQKWLYSVGQKWM